MGSSQADKAASHQRIVTAAAARIRRAGVDGLSVADLMREAGLTQFFLSRTGGGASAQTSKSVPVVLEHEAMARMILPAPAGSARGR